MRAKLEHERFTNFSYIRNNVKDNSFLYLFFFFTESIFIMIAHEKQYLQNEVYKTEPTNERKLK